MTQEGKSTIYKLLLIFATFSVSDIKLPVTYFPTSSLNVHTFLLTGFHLNCWRLSVFERQTEAASQTAW